MRRYRAGWNLVLITLVTLAACKPKPPPEPVAEAGAAAVKIVEDIQITPEVPDAGEPDAAEAGPKGSGVRVDPTVARVRACCAALSSKINGLGASPEAALLTGVAAQCNAAASTLQKNPNAPELAALKTALAGKSVPNACASL